VDLDTPEETDDSTHGMLVRDAGPEDAPFVVELLGRAGWTLSERADPANGSTTLVLYDPADGVVRGAAVVEGRAAGSYELVAWAVERVHDTAATASRLVRSAADRLRRAGAERLVVTVPVDGVSMRVLTDAGFGPVGFDPDHPSVVLTLYQEL
jgi:hypothetical protein